MASISSLGLSGLPLNDLLKDLREVEEAPLQVLSNRVTSYEAKISSYGTLSNSVATFQTAVKALGESKTFTSFKATSSDTAALGVVAEANGGAVAGSYSIHIGNLATTQSLATGGQASRTDALSTSGGTITFTLGDGSTKTLELEAGDTSLEAIRTAINKSGLGISATLINNGSDTTPFQLAITTSETGTDASISSISVDNADLQAVFGFDAEASSGNAMTEVRKAEDAQIEVNGIQIVSHSNTLKDAIEGVTLNLQAPTDAGKPVKITIDKDAALTKAAVSNFVSTYNALQTTIRSLTSYNAETQTSSVLNGDSTVRSVQTQILSVISGAVESDGEFVVLSQMGVSIDVKTGLMVLDGDKLDAALATNVADVQAFFTGEKGLAAKLNERITPMLSSTGAIANASKGAQSTIKDLKEQALNMQTRVNDRMAQYQAQFVALEKQMAQMNGITSYLTTQLSMLENLGKSNNK